jgi:2',3'-cyclic-nucleotide 2'-phosphodiesterase (5'-nucleotidase family)
MTTLELLHWNDTHGHFDGLARLSARAREIRDQATHPVLLLDGGDVEDTSVRLSALTFGVAGWRALGAAGVDAAVVGNGGLLRYGPDQLPAYAKALGSAPLVCDLEIDGATPDGAAPSTILRVGGLRVGILGTTDYYPQYDVFGIRERGRVTAVHREARALRDAGADVVVVLSHAGINHDRGLSWSVRGLVDVIVGGHTHDLLTEGDRSQGVPIAQAGWKAEHLGRIVLEVDEGGVRVVDMTLEAVPESAPPDPVVVAELEACDRDLDTWLDEPVAHLPDAVPHGAADSALARLTAAALLAGRPGEIGVLMAAHCQAGLPAGTVTRRAVWAATSSPGNAAQATLTGAQVRAMLRRGLSEEFAATTSRTFRGRPYGRLQVVGVHVDGDRVLVGDEPLDDARRYRVTGSDLELSPYGTLVDQTPDDLVVHAPAILPELLEAYLRDRFPHRHAG